MLESSLSQQKNQHRGKQMKWYKTRSPFIIAVGYNSTDKTLLVQFGSLSYKAFGDVPETEVANLLQAPSLKQYWCKYIEGHYPELPIEADE